MDFLDASDAKREFSDLLIKTQHSLITINKNGKQVAVVLSVTEYDRLQQGIGDAYSGKKSKGEDVIKRFQERVR